MHSVPNAVRTGKVSDLTIYPHSGKGLRPSLRLPSSPSHEGVSPYPLQLGKYFSRRPVTESNLPEGQERPEARAPFLIGVPDFVEGDRSVLFSTRHSRTGRPGIR